MNIENPNNAVEAAESGSEGGAFINSLRRNNNQFGEIS